MPYMVLPCGQAVLIDDEDYEWVTAVNWYVRDNPGRPRSIAHDDRLGGRLFRVRLHRAIGLRMRPELLARLKDVKVTAKNGDYCDVRRGNLEVIVRSHGGHQYTRRPEGIVLKYKRPRAPDTAIPAADIPTSPFAYLWCGGVVRRRVGYAGGGKRAYVDRFAGSIVAGEDGRSGGGLRVDHVGQHHDQGCDGQGDAEAHDGGEDQGV